MSNQYSPYSMSPGMADQYRAEAEAARVALGFKKDSGEVAPCDLTAAIDALIRQGKGSNVIEIYRDDSTTKIVLENVKHYFWTANNTVLVIAQYVGNDGSHQYIHWPRERICWFRHIKK